MDWSILGIGPSTDTKEITKAYRLKLVKTNPEDKPEEFKALREAYEEALALAQAASSQEANSGEEAADPTDPVDKWAFELEKLYNNYQQRVSVAAWEELLSQDVCYGLDTRPLIEIALLQFFMQRYLIPHEVWLVIDQRFGFSERRKELYDTYPRSFIDNVVIDGILFESALDYTLFTPGENAEECDEYTTLYLEAIRSTFEDAQPLIDAMQALSESHPYGDSLAQQALLASFLNERLNEQELAGEEPAKPSEEGEEQDDLDEQEAYAFVEEAGNLGPGVAPLPKSITEAPLSPQEQECIDALREIAQRYPQNEHLNSEFAHALLRRGLYEECLTVAKQLVEQNKESQQAIWLLAQAYESTGNYHDAVEQLNELMRNSNGDQAKLYALNAVRTVWNKSLIKQLEANLEEDPNNNDTLLDLSWAYLQNERDEDALQTALRMDQDQVNPFDYHNVFSQIYLVLERRDESFAHTKALMEVIKTMQPDGTEKTAKRMKRLPEMLSRCGWLRFAEKDEAGARAYYEQALEVDPNNADVLTDYARIMAYFGDNEYAAKLAERLTDILPSSYHGYFLLAQFSFDALNDRDAFQAVNRALELHGADLGVYVLKARILIRNCALEEAQELIDFMNEYSQGDDPSIMWVEALLEEQRGRLAGKEAEDSNENAAARAEEREHKKKALDLYRAIDALLDKGEEITWPGKIYFRMALLEGDLAPRGGNGPVDYQLQLLKKGIEKDERDFDCRDLYAWLLAKLGRREEAITAHEELVQLPHEGVDPECKLVDLYRKDLKHCAAKALGIYRIILKAQPDNPVALFYAGLCAFHTCSLQEAEQYYLREQSIEPDCIDSYRMLVYVYEAMGRLDLALTQADKLIDVAKTNNEDKLSFHYNRVRIFRRMRRPLDAVAAISEAAEAFNYPTSYRDIFEVYLQFGLINEAEKHLKEWEKRNRTFMGKNQVDASGMHRCAVHLKVVKGDMFSARNRFNNSWQQLTADDHRWLENLFAYHRGDNALLIRKINEELQSKIEAGNKDTLDQLDNLAMVLWRAGNIPDSRGYAAEALKQVNEELLNPGPNQTIFRTKHALLMALLGNEAAARSDLAAARRLPLCENCDYPACKDADIYEAYIDSMFGHDQEALEKTRAHQSDWPDETDFICFEQHLKRKLKHS